MFGKTTTCFLQENTGTTQDDYGATAPVWDDTVKFEGVLSPRTKTERLEGGTLGVISTHRLRITADKIGQDNVSKLDEKNRIRVSSTFYEIIGVTLRKGIGSHYRLDLNLIKEA